MLNLEKKESFQNILSHICAGILYCRNDEHSTILYANDYFYKMIGYTKEEMEEQFGNRFADLVIDDVSDILKTIVSAAIKKGEDLDFEFRMRKKDGSVIWMHDTARYDREANCFYVTLMDITMTKSIEMENEKLYSYLYYLPNKIIVFDPKGMIVYKNEEAENCQYFDHNINNLVDLVTPYVLGNKFSELEKRLKEGKRIYYETRYRGDIGFLGHDSNCIIPIKDKNNKILNYVQVSESLLDNSDYLTNFPTRATFESYYNKLLLSKEKFSAFLCIVDIDNFKIVNDTYGHLVGDEAIKLSGKRLLQFIGKEDYICRYGGDEFLLLLLDVTEKDVIELFNNFIVNTTAPVYLNEKEIKITYSIGVASTKGEKVSCFELIRQADEALYEVKSAGKGHMVIYENACTIAN